SSHRSADAAWPEGHSRRVRSSDDARDPVGRGCLRCLGLRDCLAAAASVHCRQHSVRCHHLLIHETTNPMSTKRILLIVAAGALLYQNLSCSVIYSGCSNTGECADGEECIKPAGEDKGERGMPEDFCDPGSTRECEAEAFNSTGELRGECVGKVQACGEDFSFIMCGVAEVCDGLDNDCDGVDDNGIEGVGQSCTNGVGVCAASGSQICDASGNAICNAT